MMIGAKYPTYIIGVCNPIVTKPLRVWRETLSAEINTTLCHNTWASKLACCEMLLH